MKRANTLRICIAFVVGIFLFFAGWYLAEITDVQNIVAGISTQSTTEATTEATEESTTEATQPVKKPESISVAIYPYVSNMELFHQVLTEMWSEIEPDVSLQYVDWNCYEDPYPNNIDVITYDAVFLSHLVEKNYVQPLDIESVDNTYGILPFAMEGAHHEGDLYGLPFLTCSSFLIYREDDEIMSQITNYGDLCKELAARKKLDPNDGLLSGYYVDAPYLYMDALIDYTGTYTTYEEGITVEQLDATIVSRLREIQSVLAPMEANDNFRVRFGQGDGSACTDYSEAIYFMGDGAAEMTLRPISFFEGENIQMFFTDLASVCTHVTDPVKLECCMKLINLMASEEFQAELCFGNGELQYMLPAREQVYLTGKEEYPFYELLYEVATNKNNRVYRFGPSIYDYIRDVGKALG